MFAAAVTQLDAYFSGHSVRFNLPLHLTGTPFHARSGRSGADSFGQSISYAERWPGELDPRASRAVCGANGKNPIAVIVPCHRVIAADGGLGGYGGGLDRNAWLLEHEADVLARHPQWDKIPILSTNYS